MIVFRCLVAAVVLVASTACSGVSSPAARDPAPAAPPQRQPAAVRTAEQVVSELAASLVTAKPGVVYTTETDPNKLLGRPNGYVSKASFTDSRIEAGGVKDDSSGSVDLGGSVEVYADEVGATARKQYIDGVFRASPALGTEYSYLDGPVLLRLSRELTPEQAAEYERALLSS